MTKAEDLGITDVEQKWVVTARHADGTGPKFSLLWRTTGKRGKPLPKIGSRVFVPYYGHVCIERIDPPGSLEIADNASTLLIKVKKKDNQ